MGEVEHGAEKCDETGLCSGGTESKVRSCSADYNEVEASYRYWYRYRRRRCLDCCYLLNYSRSRNGARLRVKRARMKQDNGRKTAYI